MTPRMLRFGRLALVIIALSCAALAARKGLQARRYFSTPIDLSGTVVHAEFVKAIPMSRGNPLAGVITGLVPTRLNLDLKEFPGIHFEVWLPEDPKLHPPLPPPGDALTLVLPGRWREMEVGPDERVLAFGLKRGAAVLLDARQYPYAAEYRTLFLAVGAGFGALFAVMGLWALRKGQWV